MGVLAGKAGLGVQLSTVLPALQTGGGRQQGDGLVL